MFAEIEHVRLYTVADPGKGVVEGVTTPPFGSSSKQNLWIDKRSMHRSKENVVEWNVTSIY